MISSRWPRPIGISASIALRPVAIGSCTDLRGMMPGALTSATRRSVVSIGALAVDRVAERVDHAAEQRLADRHVDDRAGALDDVALADVAVGAEDHDADVVGLEVQRHAADAAGELDHLAGLDVVEAVDAGDAVADGEHPADLRDLGLLAEVLDLLLEDRGDFSGLDRHYPTSFMTFCRLASLERIEVSIIREPTLTTRPPIRLSSTVTSSLTSLPTLSLSVAASASVWALVSGLAVTHLGGDLAALGGDQRLDLGDAGRGRRRAGGSAPSGRGCW